MSRCYCNDIQICSSKITRMCYSIQRITSCSSYCGDLSDSLASVTEVAISSYNAETQDMLLDTPEDTDRCVQELMEAYKSAMRNAVYKLQTEREDMEREDEEFHEEEENDQPPAAS